ncbi:MAG: hypothetical protein EOP06_05160 [Proteobacteria bacterium]|nr:MAG: hypothetical protein EOP06_05160 [Pseudomonadota bacterium]
MSIREYKKDHLKEHAGVESAMPMTLVAPKSDDPLIFWTKHATESTQVNLHPLAMGQEKRENHKGNFISFTGRPQLIAQLAPAIEDSLLGVRSRTAGHCLESLRAWWRILDAVEAAAEETGKPMTRVDDVCELTTIHSEFAHRKGMSRVLFTTFRALADTTRLALGARALYWRAPENPDVHSAINHPKSKSKLCVWR